jgi:hypothetical protein
MGYGQNGSTGLRIKATLIISHVKAQRTSGALLWGRVLLLRKPTLGPDVVVEFFVVGKRSL